VRNKKFPYSQLIKAGTKREPFLEAKERISSYGLLRTGKKKSTERVEERTNRLAVQEKH
jgi:hypothetical protein